jgi:anti-sigma factor RsiW
VETGERLAAYLAGELPADEHAAVEAALAADAGLRAQLARIRRVDAALAELGASEPEVSPEVSEAFRARLRDAVRAELDTIAFTPAGDAGATDELAARRARRTGGLPRWLAPASGAAAVLAVVGTLGVGLLSGGGEDGAETAGGMTAGDEAVTMDSAEAGLAPDVLAGPLVVSQGVAYDQQALEALVGTDALQPLVALEVDDAGAVDIAERYAAALQLASARMLDGTSAAATTEDGQDGGQEDAAADVAAAPAAPLQVVGEEPDAATAEAIARCLPPLLDASTGTVVPVYVEVATYEGEDALVYGLLSRDPETSAYTRVEIWAVAPADCRVLFFAQG